MARMSIDDMFLRDPRVLRLAKACFWNKYEARGRLLEVFALVYDRVDAGADGVVSALDIDIAAECDGFAEIMIEHGLAERQRRGIRVRGAIERTNYLATRHDSGRLGGIKSGESRRNKSKVTFKVTSEKTEGRVNPSAVPSASADPSVDPDPKEKNSAAPSVRGSRSRKSPPSGPTEAESAVVALVLEKLGQHTDTQYSGAKEHVRLIVNRLRDGLTELDLRCVIAYCAHPTGLGWTVKPGLDKYLRPETLFGPTTISKYLDASRSWYSKHVAPSEGAAA